MRADRVGDVGRRKVRVVLLRHPRSAWPSCSAMTPIGNALHGEGRAVRVAEHME